MHRSRYIVVTIVYHANSRVLNMLRCLKVPAHAHLKIGVAAGPLRWITSTIIISKPVIALRHHQYKTPLHDTTNSIQPHSACKRSLNIVINFKP